MTAAAFYKKLREYLFAHAVSAGLFNHWSDERFLKYAYKRSVGKELDLDNPKGFGEKLQWLKLHDRRPEYTNMVDKYEAKRYVADKIGSEYIIPTIGVWDSFDDIDFDALPEQFVLKCTHDSGGLVICRDKGSLDVSATREKLSKRLSRNFYWIGREWPYKNIQPRIIAEEYIESKTGGELNDYKVLCFNGVPRLIEYHSGRFGALHTQDLYTVSWERLDCYQIDFPSSGISVPMPELLGLMLELSAELSESLAHVRVDWYIVDGRLYFGELTFFNGSGFQEFIPTEYDLLFGSWIPTKQQEVTQLPKL